MFIGLKNNIIEKTANINSKGGNGVKHHVSYAYINIKLKKITNIPMMNVQMEIPTKIRKNHLNKEYFFNIHPPISLE